MAFLCRHIEQEEMNCLGFVIVRRNLLKKKKITTKSTPQITCWFPQSKNKNLKKSLQNLFAVCPCLCLLWICPVTLVAAQSFQFFNLSFLIEVLKGYSGCENIMTKNDGECICVFSIGPFSRLIYLFRGHENRLCVVKYHSISNKLLTNACGIPYLMKNP